MIHYMHGSIFDSQCQYLVNPVNCVEVMGAGLAKEFKRRYPDRMFQKYVNDCASGKLRMGMPTKHFKSGVVFFPTKDHWRDKSNLEWIDQGLRNVVRFTNMQHWKVDSIAFPKLGCGLGGLDWAKVKPVMEGQLGELSEKIRIEVWI